MLHGNLGLLYADLKIWKIIWTLAQSRLQPGNILATKNRSSNPWSTVRYHWIALSVTMNRWICWKKLRSYCGRSIPDRDRCCSIAKMLSKSFRNYEKPAISKSKQYYDQYRIFSEEKDLDLNKLKSAVDEEKYLKEMAINQAKSGTELIENNLNCESLRSICNPSRKKIRSWIPLYPRRNPIAVTRQKAQTDNFLALTTRIQLQREKAVRNSFGLAALSCQCHWFFLYGEITFRWKNQKKTISRKKKYSNRNSKQELDELKSNHYP